MNLKIMFKLILIFLVILMFNLTFLSIVLVLLFLLCKLSIALLPTLTIFCVCISIFISSFITSRFINNYELRLSLIYGLIVTSTLTLINSLTIQNFFNLTFFIKICLIVVTSFLGGVACKIFK